MTPIGSLQQVFSPQNGGKVDNILDAFKNRIEYLQNFKFSNCRHVLDASRKQLNESRLEQGSIFAWKFR